MDHRNVLLGELTRKDDKLPARPIRVEAVGDQAEVSLQEAELAQ